MSERPLPDLRREDFQNALNDFDSYIDITLDDLMQINTMARKHARFRKTEKLSVSKIMTSDVVTVSPRTSLRDAAGILLERRISGLPVVDEEGKLSGIVTEADFLCAMGIPCHHPAHNLWQSLEAMFKHQPGIGERPARVADIMAPQVISIAGDKTLHDAIDAMKKHHIKRLVVVDDQYQVQGIITRSNLVQVLLQQIL
jgi:CBS domain-containing membrane protein